MTNVTTLHFDLSHAPQDVDHTLHIAGQDYVLTAHTPQTLQLHASRNPMLAAVPVDQQHHVSHFAENVALPSGVALMFVQHPAKDANAPLPALSLMATYIPPGARPAPTAASGPSLAARKLAVLGAAPPALDPGDDHGNSFRTPLDTALSLVSMHPELMHLDPATAAHIHDTHLVSAPGVNDLALAISAQGAADVDGGWATISACVDENGATLTNDAGQPVYHYALSDATQAALAAPVKGALRTSKNDLALKDKTWGQSYGLASIDHSASSTSSFAGQVTAGTGVSETPQPTPPTTADAQWVPQDWSGIHGLTLGTAQQYGDSFAIDVTNNALRHMGTWVEFLDDMGNVTSDSRQQLDLLTPGNFLMGIPISTGATTLSFTMPSQASGARILFGTLGTGHFDSSVSAMGTFCTSLFEMAVPTFMLVAGVWKGDDDGEYEGILKDKYFMAAIAAVAVDFISPILARTITSDPVGALLMIGNKLMATLLKSAMGRLRDYIVKKMVIEEAERCIPFVGFVFAALGVAGTLVDLAETTAAVIQTPSKSSIEIARTMKLGVSVQPDPQHSVWPSTAHHYRLMVQYQGGTFMHLNGEMFEITNGVTSSATLSKSLSNVPAGGSLKVYAVIYSKNWWICGYASSPDWVDARPGPDGSMTVGLVIKEQLVPLSADTLYSHNEKLAYDSTNGHYWTGASSATTSLAAPTDTAKALDDTPDGHKLAELVDITINDHAHMLGYCWRAGGQGLPLVGDTAASNAQMYTFQNISYLATPDTGLKAVNRGMTGKPHILYDQFGPIEEGATGAGNNFYLDVVDKVYHLRRVDFDGQPFDLTATAQSWGQFTQPHLDAVVVHPAGYVAAVSWANSKMELLRIPAQGSAEVDAPVAVLCSGEGLREGLMNGPIAMAVTPDGKFLILETKNNRIQAFDTAGKPVQAFTATSGMQSFMALKEQTGTVTYLDVGTESKGYIYVLSCLNSGEAQTDYNLDIYQPTGEHLCTTNGLNAAKIVVSMWRDVYALNYEVLLGPQQRTEPSISQWIPSTPAGTDPNG